jgi:hypothetical protein
MSSLAVPATQYTSAQSVPSSLYGAERMAVTTSYSGVQTNLVVPFVANMYADASAQMGVLQRQDVTITGIDDVFDICCSLVNAANLLNAFSVKDVDVLGNLGLSAEVAVDFADPSSSFMTALSLVIADGDQNNAATDASGVPLHKYLTDETHSDLLSMLAHNQLADMLEASDLNVTIALDASSGAANMTSALSASGGYVPQYRKAIFAQIPEYTVEQYIKVSNGIDASGLEDVSGLNFLPLLVGDVLTFVFDVTVGQYNMGSNSMPQHGANVQRVFRDNNTNYPSSIADASWNSVDANGNPIGWDISFNQDPSGGYVSQQAVTYPSSGGLTFVAPTKRRVALKVHLGSKDGVNGNVFDYSGSLREPNAVLTGTAANANGNVVRQ